MTGSPTGGELLTTLAAAWGDGRAFADVFARDALFVNIVGEVLRGRDDIADHHEELFATLYAGSTMVLAEHETHEVLPGVVTFLAEAQVQLPGVAISTRAAGMGLLTEEGWRIQLFQNMIPFTPPT